MTFGNNNPPDVTKGFTDREIDWIYPRIQWGYNLLVETTEQKRSIIKERMNLHEEHYEETCQLQRNSQSLLIPDVELEWIDKSDLRQIYWIKNWLKQSSQQTIPVGYANLKLPDITFQLPNITFYREFIFHLDNWNTSLLNKRSFIQALKSAWHFQLQNDRQLGWIDRKNPDQIFWAWNYLKGNLALLYPNNIWSSMDGTDTPINDEERYLYIFSKFDASTVDPYLKKEIQRKMKQAWSQKTFRTNLKNSNKKQSTYALSVESKTQLQTLAKQSNVNLNQMLEYIIDQAYKNRKKGKSED